MACDLFRRCVTRQYDEDWSELTQRYGRRFRSLVRRALVRNDVPRPDQEVEDYLQEFFLRLLTLDGCSFRGHDELQLWCYLARIADNLVADRRRGRYQAHRRERQQTTMSHPAPGPSPECRVIVREHLRSFLRCCRRAAGGVELKIRIMRLAFFDGLSSPEITCALRGRLSPSQVDSLIYRLRQQLARQGVEVARRRRTASMLAP